MLPVSPNTKERKLLLRTLFKLKRFTGSMQGIQIGASHRSVKLPEKRSEYSNLLERH